MMMSVQEIQEIISCECVGNDRMKVLNLNRLDSSTDGDLSFCVNETYEWLLDENYPTMVIIHKDTKREPDSNQCFFLSENPYYDFIKIIRHVDEARENTDNKKMTNAVIGRNVSIGEGSYLADNVVVGDNVRIGDNTVVYPNVTIYDDTIIGDNCIIHANAVIGADGFGFQQDEDGKYIKIPHLGNVIIENDVEIGANTCIDRALVGSTFIRNGVKLDNLIQVAHNCEIGEDTAIASQAGISGSVKIGKRGRIGGQVGISGHLEICDDVTILAQSGVAKTVSEAGTYFGSPIKPQSQAFRIEASLRNLPQLASDISDLKKIVKVD